MEQKVDFFFNSKKNIRLEGTEIKDLLTVVSSALAFLKRFQCLSL